MPSAVALLNYISSGILWRIFCQTGIFAGLSLHIINFAVRIREAGNQFLGSINVYKYGLWSQWDIKLPMYHCLRNFGTKFFFWDNHFMSHFEGHFEEASTFLTPKLSLAALGTILGVKKVLASSKCPSKWLIMWLSRKKKLCPAVS